MAGDHKCPVCQSTFTRPQHVARHMRSHTGDRPYKCQHCGDAFARSDLLSRHVNKCHSAEKAAAVAAAVAAGLPPPTSGKGRRGRSTVSTKAPCDQCTIAKLPCNSGEPCTKCVAKNIRCTYSQLPKASLPSLTLSQPGAATQPRPPRNSYDLNAVHPYEYQYPVVPSSTAPPNPNDQLYSSLSSSLPPQFTFPPSLSMYAANPQAATSSATPLDYYAAPQFRRPQSSHQDHLLDYSPPSTASSTGGFNSGLSGKYPQYAQQLNGKTKPIYSPSIDNASSPELQQGLSHQFANYLPTNDGRPQTAGEGGFSNAFGLMSIDDPNVLAGLASHSPFFYDSLIANGQAPSANHGSRDVPTPNARDLREWYAFMRTPSDRTLRRNSNDDSYIVGAGATPVAERPDMGTRRVSRRASVPNIPKDLQPPIQMQQQPPQIGNIGQANNLKEYEAAVLARGPPVDLKIDPSSLRRSRIRHSPSSQQQQRQNSQQHSPLSATHGDRVVLPPGRNAPFIGPPPASSPRSSEESSPAGSLHLSLPHPQSHLHPSSQSHVQHQPPQWQQPSSRPKPKRNASQTLEQEVQKTHRNSGAADVSGESSHATGDDSYDSTSGRESRSSYTGSSQSRYGGYSISPVGRGLPGPTHLSGHSSILPPPASVSTFGDL